MQSSSKTSSNQNDQINAYLKQRLTLYGHFSRNGWQTWIHLVLHHPQDFPISIQQFLDNAVSPVLFPMVSSSLDGMMHSYYKVHEERMFKSTLANMNESAPETTYDELREKRWKSLTSSMSILLTRHLLNLPGSTIAGARSAE